MEVIIIHGQMVLLKLFFKMFSKSILTMLFFSFHSIKKLSAVLYSESVHCPLNNMWKVTTFHVPIVGSENLNLLYNS